MKKFILILFLLFAVKANSQKTSESNTEKINNLYFKDYQIKDYQILKSAILDYSSELEVPFGYDEVTVEDEMIKLFDPENFKCDCDEKVIKNIKKVVASKKTNNTPEKLGFIPDVVKSRIGNNPAFKLSGLGSKILANSFTYTYIENGKAITKSGTAIDSPTSKNFNIETYFEYDASNFLYSLDCSGYLSAALSFDIGVSGNAIETSAKGAAKSKNSLIIISGIMYSPLYQAYKGFGNYKDETKEILEFRKQVINQIIKSIPNYANDDKTNISLDTDYKVVIASNKGDSSFNGEASLSGKTGTGFGFGSFSIKGESGGEIGRKSKFSDFDCYVIKKNNLNEPDILTIKDLNAKIVEIDSKLKSIVAKL